MKKFFVLLKVSVKSLLLSSTSVGRGMRKKAVTGMSALAILAFLALYISGVYSSLLLDVLAPLGMEVMVFIYMGLAAVIGGLLFTVMAVRGVVFGGKDNDLLLSMPVPSSVLMASRVSAIYLENLVFSVFMLVPAGVACAIFTRSGVGHTLLFWVRVLIAAVALPLLDTALSVALGALVAFVSTRVSRGKALGQNVVMGLFLALVFWFSFSINGMILKLAADAQGVKDSLGWALPFVWLGDGILGDWGKLLLFVAVCVIPFVLVVVILGRCYRRAVTAFQSQSARSDYKLSRQKGLGQTKALLRKEAARFFGSPIYLWNAGLGIIFLLAIAVLALVKKELLMELLSQFGTALPAFPLCGAVMGFCLCTVTITAPSVSLEGRYFWILKEAPVGERAIIRLKVCFQLMLSLPATFIACLCLAVAFGLPVWQGAALCVAMMAFAVGQASFGMLMGLAFPKMDAVNDTVVVKQSLAVLLTMFVPMAVLAAAGGLYWLGSRGSEGLALGLSVAFVFLLAAVCAGVLQKRGPALLREL